MVAEQGYHLKSELAQYCLPRPEGHPERTLAWVNSICLLFLVIAWSGARPHLPMPKDVPPLEQPVPIVIQPMAPPPPQAIQPTKEQTTEQDTVAPRVVVVTPMSPAINFSVPTIGNVVVPNAIAVAPPAVALQPRAVIQHEPKTIGSTGRGGDRPQPPYPEMALKFGEQGTVVLLLTVDDSGVVQSISLKETSGSSILDKGAMDFVKRHWIVPPGSGGRVFIATIAYKIQSDS